VNVSEGLVAIRVRLFGAEKTAAEVETMNAAIAGTGEAATTSAAATAASGTRIGSVIGRMRGAWTTILKVAKFAALGIAGALAGIAVWGRHAVHNTEELAKTTLVLHQATGASFTSTSSWLSVIKAWGGDMGQASMAIKTFSSNVLAASEGSSGASKAFHRLGFDAGDLKSALKDPTGSLINVTAGLEAMPDGAAKFATGTKLFGKGWRTLLPILSQGTQKVKEQLGWARQYGAVLSKNPVEALHELKEASIKSSLAMQGLEIMFTEKVVPAITTAVLWFDKLILQFRHGKGPIHAVVHAVEPFVKVLIEIGKWLVESQPTLNVVIAMFIAWKVATLAAAAAQTLFNFALYACPIFWLIGGIFLLGVALYLAYHRIKLVHDAVDKVSQTFGGWINLVGYLTFAFSPLAAVALLVIGHFKTLKSVGSDAFKWVLNAAENLYGFFTTNPIGQVLVAPFRLVYEQVKWVIERIEDLFGVVKDVVGFAESINPFGGGHSSSPTVPNNGFFGPGTKPPTFTPGAGTPKPHPGSGHRHRVPTSSQRVVPTGTLDLAFAGGGPLRTMQPFNIYLNNRAIAEGVAEAREDEEARR
jgi:hypothetical protein